MISQQEREVLRRLAAEWAAWADKPIQQERIRLWKALNGLRPERPMVWITEIPWGELRDHPDLALQCTNRRARQVEAAMRERLFTQQYLSVDEVLPPYYLVRKRVLNAGYGVEVEEERLEQGESYIQSHDYKAVISEVDDIEKIRMPEATYDREATEESLAFFDDLFGDILPPRLTGVQQHFFPAWDILVCWTGVTEALMDLVVRPDFIHALMRRMTDSFLTRMTQLEDLGLLDPYPPLWRVGSGAAGFTDELPATDADATKTRTRDQWGGATPQIFSDVSPEMHEEFALAYENEVMSRCGLNYYGCCEPVHNKMHLLAKVPNLRKISISPWCKTDVARENAATKYVFSHKPNPACLASQAFDQVAAANDLRARLEQSGPMPCEIIMKDISTVKGDVQRVIDWCRIATETATTWAS